MLGPEAARVLLGHDLRHKRAGLLFPLGAVERHSGDIQAHGVMRWDVVNLFQLVLRYPGVAVNERLLPALAPVRGHSVFDEAVSANPSRVGPRLRDFAPGRAVLLAKLPAAIFVRVLDERVAGIHDGLQHGGVVVVRVVRRLDGPGSREREHNLLIIDDPDALAETPCVRVLAGQNAGDGPDKAFDELIFEAQLAHGLSRLR